MKNPSKKNKLVVPVVKWVGGKRQLLSELDRFFPAQFTRYYEPFVGGGAVLFHMQPKKAVINDSNEELVNLYKVVKEEPNSLIEDLGRHVNTEDYFYEVRSQDRDKLAYAALSDVERASRMIFLNKTCYNGLFRVNSSGEFNSPYGRYKNPNIINEFSIRAVSDYMSRRDVDIRHGDFESSLKGVTGKSFVYFDPPYDPVSNSSSFTGYTRGGFDRAEQERLKLVCDRLNRKGVRFMLSNSATAFILDLYRDYAVEIVKAKRSVNSVAERRGVVDEVLVRNYE